MIIEFVGGPLDGTKRHYPKHFEFRLPLGQALHIRAGDEAPHKHYWLCRYDGATFKFVYETIVFGPQPFIEMWAQVHDD